MVQTRSSKRIANNGEYKEKHAQHEPTGIAEIDSATRLQATVHTTSSKTWPHKFTVPFSDDKQIECERSGTDESPDLIFTHGAGGGLAAPAIAEFADGFAASATILCFKGTMNLGSRTKHFVAVAERYPTCQVFGGRSMGSRAACALAAEHSAQARALVLVSYPLVGGKNSDSREQVLLSLPADLDVLFVSGDKDSMCDLRHLEDVQNKMEARCWTVKVVNADHGMNWSPKSSAVDMRRRTGAIAAEWIQHRDADRRSGEIWYDDGDCHWSGWTLDGDRTALPKTTNAEPSKKRKRDE